MPSQLPLEPLSAVTVFTVDTRSRNVTTFCEDRVTRDLQPETPEQSSWHPRRFSLGCLTILAFGPALMPVVFAVWALIDGRSVRTTTWVS